MRWMMPNKMDKNPLPPALAFVGVCQIAFLIFKLMGLVDWTWEIVMLPVTVTGVLLILSGVLVAALTHIGGSDDE